MPRGQAANSLYLPAPYGGLNTRDPFGALPQQDALMLDNFFPGFGSVSVRNGCRVWATDLPSTVKSLIPYNGANSSTDKLFALDSSGNVYDASSADSVGAAYKTGLTPGATMRGVNFGGLTDHFLCCVNGYDLPQWFDGTTWTETGSGFAPAITGVSADNFTSVAVWRNRLWFAEKNSAVVWYLPLLSIGGAASAWDLTGLLPRGGHIIAVTTFAASSSGATNDQYIAFISSQGEVIVYGGTDPDVSGQFAIVGVYRIGSPIGYNCYTNLLNEAMIVTRSGLAPISALLGADIESSWGTVADKVRPAISADAQLYGSVEGWCIEYAPYANKLFVNVPSVSGGKAKQYVMNTVTKAWCTFSGLDITCMAYFHDELYAGIGRRVVKLDQPGGDFATDDSLGFPKTARALTAYTYTRDALVTKQFLQGRVLMNISGIGIVPKIGVNVDFQENEILSTLVAGAASGGIWDVAVWDHDIWGYNDSVNNSWVTLHGAGLAAALKTSVTVTTESLSWQSWQLLYNAGGIL
jgi:hypothetical protein